MVGMGRVNHRTSWAILTSAAVAFGSLAIVPTAAAGPVLPLAAKKKAKKKKKAAAPKPAGLTPEEAETKRQAIRDAVESDRAAGSMRSVARGLEDNGAILGDPVVLLEAGEVRLGIAAEERDIDEAQRSIETTLVALDVLYFYDAVSDGQAESDWLVIEPSRAGGLISDGKRQIEKAESLIEEIERERRAEEAPDDGPRVSKADKKKRERKPMRPGTGLIIAGTGFTVLGVVGASLGFAGLAISSSKQKEVEGKQIPEEQDEVERLDAEGKRANTMGYAGIGLAVGALAVGIPLLVVGVKKRKSSPSASARIRLAPMVSGHQNGFVLSGSF
jgi:hypothetical protein